LVTPRELRFTVRHRRWRSTAVAVLAVALLATAGCSAAAPGASQPQRPNAQPVAFTTTGDARVHGSASAGPNGARPGADALAARSATASASPTASERPPPAGTSPPAGTAAPSSATPGATSRASAGPGPIVALGDSYTAGDMLPLDLTAQPLGCLRSTRSYPVLVARALRATRDLIDMACTGAGWKAMTTTEHTSTKDNPPQLAALTPGTRLVLLTLGGDDLGFMNTLKLCMKLSWTKPWGRPCQQHLTAGGTDQLAALITAEGPRITTALTQIHAQAPNAKVVLVGYPDMFPQRGSCWPVVPITAGDIAYLRGIELELNATLRASARATGATFIDAYTPSVGRDFCADGDTRYVEGLVPGSLTAPFHLNARGHSAVASLILAALAR
jgi:lysophospholipase L1-like esterase